MKDGIRAGFVGLGNLGSFLCRSLVKTSGLPVTVFDLRREAVEEMVALGAIGASSAREVGAKSDIVISLVRDERQNDAVIFGKDGLWEGAKKGDITVIASTVSPTYVRDLYAKGKKDGIHVVGAAVTKSTNWPHPHNVEGWATLMVGGDDEDVKKCWPVFESMAKYVVHLGGPGAGQAAKLVNNEASTVYASITHYCLVEYLNLGLKAGLSLPKMVEVWAAGMGTQILDDAGLKPWFNQQEIVDALRKTSPRSPAAMNPPGEEQLENFSAMYRRLCREMAAATGAKMPISELSDKLTAEASTYDALAAQLTK